MNIRPSTLIITLVGDARGNVSVRTDLAQPAVGASITPVQALGLDLVMQCRHKGHEVVHGAQHVPTLAFAMDVCNPDAYGWAVQPEVFQIAKGIVAQSQHAGNATGATA